MFNCELKPMTRDGGGGHFWFDDIRISNAVMMACMCGRVYVSCDALAYKHDISRSCLN